MVDNKEQEATQATEVQQHDVQYAEEGESKPVIEKVEVKTGTEKLECIYKQRMKLYRFRNDQWKERGIGYGELMRDRDQKRIRFCMRQEKTLKVVANFYGKSRAPMLNSGVISDEHVLADADAGRKRQGFVLGRAGFQ